MDVRWTEAAADSWQRGIILPLSNCRDRNNQERKKGKKKLPFNLVKLRFWQVGTDEKYIEEEEKSDFGHKGTMMMSFEGREGRG